MARARAMRARDERRQRMPARTAPGKREGLEDADVFVAEVVFEALDHEGEALLLEVGQAVYIPGAPEKMDRGCCFEAEVEESATALGNLPMCMA